MRSMAMILSNRLYRRLPFLRYPSMIFGLGIIFSVVIALLFISFLNFHESTSYQSRFSSLQKATASIKYYDEVLTNSTRMSAVSGDDKWEARYQSVEPKLDDAIRYVLELEPLLQKHLEIIDAANRRLISMELETFALVKAHKQSEAVDLIFSRQYETEKEIYQNHLQALLTDLEKITAAFEQQQRESTLYRMLLVWLLLFAILFVLWRSFQTISHRLMMERMLTETSNNMIKQNGSNFNQRINKALSIFLNTLNIDQVWVMHRGVGTPPHLINLWRCSKHHYPLSPAGTIDENALTDYLLRLEADGNQTFRLYDVEQMPAAPGLTGIKSIHGVLLPFNSNDEMLLALVETMSGKQIADEIDLPVFSSFAGILISALQNQIKEDHITRLAMTDGLTQLLNRRQFDIVFDREWHQSKLSPISSFYMMIDIDWFKKVNDSHGHEIGDIVLASLAQMLKSSLREQDLIGRYGGEEFCVFLMNVTGQEASVTAERLRNTVAVTPVMTNAGPISFTISIGIAQVLMEDMSPEDTAKRADQALYEAKNSGRNRVCFG